MMGSILSRNVRRLLLLKEVQRAIDFVLSESVGVGGIVDQHGD